MNLNDVKVLIFAFVAFFVLLVRVDGRTRYGRKNSSSGNNTEGQAFHDIYSPFDNVNSSYSGLLNNLTLNSSSTSSHSKERDSISYDSSSSEYDSSHYTEEKSEKKRKQHPKRKRETRQRDGIVGTDELQQCGTGYADKCCDAAVEMSQCACRCGDGVIDADTSAGTYKSCKEYMGSFGTRPTLVSGIGNGDGAGGPGGSDSSTASRTTTMDLISILSSICSTGFLVGIISCVLLICAF